MDGAEFPWSGLPDEELLNLRICDLGVRLEGSDMEPRVAELYTLLETRGVLLRPKCYLGEEWFSPTGSPTIAIPFYLAHPRLRELEMKQMLEVEGGSAEQFQQLLRHECGHAVDHAYKISDRPEWAKLFGSRDEDYQPVSYRPHPYSKSFVENLPNWYAQSHPDEDFAETFAVWLSDPPEVWRAKYKGWKALEKLEFVNTVMCELANARPVNTRGRRMGEAKDLRRTLRRYYEQRRALFAEDFPDFYDADLRRIFEPKGAEPKGEPKGQVAEGAPPPESAAKYLKQQQKAMVASTVQWTGQRKYTVDALISQFIYRCKELKLTVPADTKRVQFELGAYLAALVTNHLYTGKFKRSV